MNDKSGGIVIIFLAAVAVGACVGAVLFINLGDSEPVEVNTDTDIEVVVEEAPVVEETETKVIERKSVAVKIAPDLTEEEKKAKAAKEWEEAGKEMNDLYQGSKMQELIQKKMTEGNQQWFAELFEKYNIDSENQKIIAGAVTEAQTDFFNELMANGFFKDADEEKRAEVAEKLRAIDTECEETIKQAGGEAFLVEAQAVRKTELRDQYLNRVDRRLKKNKMSNDQRTAMDSLYETNQITQSEVWFLPKSEIDERKENMNSGAEGIRNEKQYEEVIRTNRDPFNFK